jgi:hypothetical protein
MSDPNSISNLEKYVLWLIQNVFLPLLPFFITAFIDVCVKAQIEILGQESILIYTIILPILYLEQSDGGVQKYIFWVISVIGIVLFTVNHMLIKFPPRGDPNSIRRIAFLALLLDILYIVAASVYEAYKTFSTNRQVT